jgi:transcriptional regulator with XRE-family HTH domain
MDYQARGFVVSVGTRIREARRRRGITQEQLGELINKSQNLVSAYENGTKTLDLNELPNVAAALRVSMSYLVGESSVEEELDVLDEIVIEPLRIAARITILRCLDFQNAILALVTNSKNSLEYLDNSSDLNLIYAEYREGLINQFDRYWIKLLKWYEEMRIENPDVKPLSAEHAQKISDTYKIIYEEIMSPHNFPQDE